MMEKVNQMIEQLLDENQVKGIKAVRYSEYTIWIDDVNGETWSLQFCHAEPGQSTWLAD